jgi:hypothetical protein
MLKKLLEFSFANAATQPAAAAVTGPRNMGGAVMLTAIALIPLPLFILALPKAGSPGELACDIAHAEFKALYEAGEMKRAQGMLPELKKCGIGNTR